MHLFDPQRPILFPSDREQYLDQNGRVCACVPSPDVEPNGDGTFTIRVMLKVDNNSFAWHSTTVTSTNDIAKFFDQWVEDPEKTMITVLKWKGVSDRVISIKQQRSQPQPQPNILVEVSEDDL
jgi:hypothetical protein